MADLLTSPKEPKSTSLSLEDEAIIVAFRQHTLLPLDDCLYAGVATISLKSPAIICPKPMTSRGSQGVTVYRSLDLRTDKQDSHSRLERG